jgi:hypothetical protein
MSKKIKNFVSLVLVSSIALMPLSAYAQGKIFNISKGQKAPFSGTLFDVEASADLTVRLESHAAQCTLKLTKAKELCENESLFKINLKVAELEALQLRHNDILKIKNDQIDFLQKKALGDAPWYENNKLWFATGIVIGFAISMGSAYAWGQVSD